jgi:hypothetical protein
LISGLGHDNEDNRLNTQDGPYRVKSEQIDHSHSQMPQNNLPSQLENVAQKGQSRLLSDIALDLLHWLPSARFSEQITAPSLGLSDDFTQTPNNAKTLVSNQLFATKMREIMALDVNFERKKSELKRLFELRKRLGTLEKRFYDDVDQVGLKNAQKTKKSNKMNKLKQGEMEGEIDLLDNIEDISEGEADLVSLQADSVLENAKTRQNLSKLAKMSENDENTSNLSQIDNSNDLEFLHLMSESDRNAVLRERFRSTAVIPLFRPENENNEDFEIDSRFAMKSTTTTSTKDRLAELISLLSNPENFIQESAPMDENSQNLAKSDKKDETEPDFTQTALYKNLVQERDRLLRLERIREVDQAKIDGTWVSKAKISEKKTKLSLQPQNQTETTAADRHRMKIHRTTVVGKDGTVLNDSLKEIENLENEQKVFEDEERVKLLQKQEKTRFGKIRRGFAGKHQGSEHNYRSDFENLDENDQNDWNTSKPNRSMGKSQHVRQNYDRNEQNRQNYGKNQQKNENNQFSQLNPYADDDDFFSDDESPHIALYNQITANGNQNTNNFKRSIKNTPTVKNVKHIVKNDQKSPNVTKSTKKTQTAKAPTMGAENFAANDENFENFDEIDQDGQVFDDVRDSDSDSDGSMFSRLKREENEILQEILSVFGGQNVSNLSNSTTRSISSRPTTNHRQNTLKPKLAK